MEKATAEARSAQLAQENATAEQEHNAERELWSRVNDNLRAALINAGLRTEDFDPQAEAEEAEAEARAEAEAEAEADDETEAKEAEADDAEAEAKEAEEDETEAME